MDVQRKLKKLRLNETKQNKLCGAKERAGDGINQRSGTADLKYPLDEPVGCTNQNSCLPGNKQQLRARYNSTGTGETREPSHELIMKTMWSCSTAIIPTNSHYLRISHFVTR